MPTFETQPSWWISLATLTQWFWWPAISAFFSLGALLWTIRLADRANRADRRAGAVALLIARSLLGGAVAPARIYIRSAKTQGFKHQSWSTAAIKSDENTAASKDLMAFDLLKLPTIDAYRKVSGAKVDVATIYHEFRFSVDHNVEPDIVNIADKSKLVESLCNELYFEARRMLSGKDWRNIHGDYRPAIWVWLTSLRPLVTWAREAGIRTFKRYPGDTR